MGAGASANRTQSATPSDDDPFESSSKRAAIQDVDPSLAKHNDIIRTNVTGSVIVSGVERALFIREKGLQKLLHDVVIDTFRDIPESMGLDHNSHDVRLRPTSVRDSVPDQTVGGHFFISMTGPRGKVVDVASKVKQNLLGTFRKGSKRSQHIGRVFRRRALEQGVVIDSEVHVAVVQAMQLPIELVERSQKEEHAWGFPYSSSGHHGHAVAKRTSDYVAGLRESAHEALDAIAMFMHKHDNDIKPKKDSTFDYRSPTGESIIKQPLGGRKFTTVLKLRDGTTIKRTAAQTVCTRANGSKLVAAADRSKFTESKVDRTSLTLDMMGTRFVMVRPNGAKTYRFEKRKLALEYKPDGSLLQCDGALGLVIHVLPSKSGFFTISFTYNDGTTVMWQSDGTSRQSCVVHKTAVLDATNPGSHTTETVDNSVIERFADGRSIRHSPSGWVVEAESNGTIVSATKPDGSALDPKHVGSHEDEELRQLMSEVDRMEQPWRVVDSLTVQSSQNRALRQQSRPLGWPIWLMSGMLVQRDHLKESFSDRAQLEKVWQSSTYSLDQISMKQALFNGASQQRASLTRLDDSTSSDDEFSFGAGEAIDVNKKPGVPSTGGKRSQNQLREDYTSSSLTSSSTFTETETTDTESSTLTTSDTESSTLTPSDYESSELTPSDSSDEEIKYSASASTSKGKSDDMSTKGGALTLAQVYALRRQQRKKGAAYSSSDDESSSSSGDDSWFASMRGGKKGAKRSKKRSNIDVAKQALLRSRMRAQRALTKKAKKAKFEESRKRLHNKKDGHSSASTSSDDDESTSSDEGVETWLIPQQSKGTSHADNRMKRRHKFEGSHVGHDSSTDDDSTSSDGVEQWTIKKKFNRMSGESVHGRRRRVVNVSLAMSGISASQMQRSDEMQEALKRAVGLMMQKSIKASSKPGASAFMEVGTDTTLTCTPMPDGMLTVRLGIPVVESQIAPAKSKQATSGLEATIKASHQLGHFARQFQDNDGSVLITSFKQQAASMGDHTINLAPVRLHKYEPDPEGVRRVAEMYMHTDKTSDTDNSLQKPVQVHESVLDGAVVLDIKTSDKSQHLKETQINSRVKMAFRTCMSDLLRKHCSNPQVALTSIENAPNGKGVKIGYRCNLFQDGSEEDAKRAAQDVASALHKTFTTRKDENKRNFMKMMRLRTGILPSDDPKSTFGFRDVGDVTVERQQNLMLIPTPQDNRDNNEMSTNRASLQNRRRPQMKKFSFKATEPASSTPSQVAKPSPTKPSPSAPLKLTRAKTNARIVISGLSSKDFVDNADLAFALTATLKNHVLRALGRENEVLPPPQEESKDDDSPLPAAATPAGVPKVNVEVRPHRPGQEGRPDVKFQLVVEEPRATADKAQARKWKQLLVDQASKGKHSLVNTFRRRKLRTAFFREFRLFARAALLRLGFGKLVESIGEIAPAAPRATAPKTTEARTPEAKVSVDEMRAGVKPARTRNAVDSKVSDDEESELDENYEFDFDDWIDDQDGVGGGMFSGPIKVKTSSVHQVIRKAVSGNNKGEDEVVYEDDFESDNEKQYEWSSDFDSDDEDDLKKFLQKQVAAGVTGAVQASAGLQAASQNTKPREKKITETKMLSVVGSIPLTMRNSCNEGKDDDETEFEVGRAALEKALKELVTARGKKPSGRKGDNDNFGGEGTGDPSLDLASLFDVHVRAPDDADSAGGGFTSASFSVKANPKKVAMLSKRKGKWRRKRGALTRALKRDAEQIRRRIESVLQRKQERMKFAERVAHFASDPSSSSAAPGVEPTVTIGTDAMASVMVEKVAKKKPKKDDKQRRPAVKLKDAVGDNDLSQVDVRGTIALNGIQAESISNGPVLREALQKAIGRVAHSCIGSSSATAAGSAEAKVAILKAQTQLQAPKVRIMQVTQLGDGSAAVDFKISAVAVTPQAPATDAQEPDRASEDEKVSEGKDPEPATAEELGEKSPPTPTDARPAEIDTIKIFVEKMYPVLLKEAEKAKAEQDADGKGKSGSVKVSSQQLRRRVEKMMPVKRKYNSREWAAWFKQQSNMLRKQQRKSTSVSPKGASALTAKEREEKRRKNHREQIVSSLQTGIQEMFQHADKCQDFMSSVSRELVDSTKQSKRRNKGKKKAKVKTDGVLAMSLWGEAVLKESLITAPRLRVLNGEQKSTVIRQQEALNQPRKRSNNKRKSEKSPKKSDGKDAKSSRAKKASPKGKGALNKKRFPRRWGGPPPGSMPDEDEEYDMNDWYELPGGYGKGPKALVTWVQSKLDKEASGGGGRASGTNKPFPRRWGAPPPGSMPDEDAYEDYDMNDWYELPGGYGKGPAELGKWVQAKLDKDKAKGREPDSDYEDDFDADDEDSPQKKKATGAKTANSRRAAQKKSKRSRDKLAKRRSHKKRKKAKKKSEKSSTRRPKEAARLTRLEREVLEKEFTPSDDVSSKGVGPILTRGSAGVTMDFPTRWGPPPQFRDDPNQWVKLPGHYGQGPPILAQWVQEKLEPKGTAQWVGTEANRLVVGSEVEVRKRAFSESHAAAGVSGFADRTGSAWWSGEVVRVNGPRVDVRYGDKTTERNIPISQIRSMLSDTLSASLNRIGSGVFNQTKNKLQAKSQDRAPGSAYDFQFDAEEAKSGDDDVQEKPTSASKKDKRAKNKKKHFPQHWGQPPAEEDGPLDHDSSDWVDLPGGYGRGSPVLSEWVKRKLERDRRVKRGSPAGAWTSGSDNKNALRGLTRSLPKSWGNALDGVGPEEYDSDDWVDLPFGYGRGPESLSKWIVDKSDRMPSVDDGNAASDFKFSEEYDMNDWYSPTVEGSIEVGAGDIARSLSGNGNDPERDQEAMVERIRQSIQRQLEEQIRSNAGERKVAGCRAVVTVSVDQAPGLPSASSSKRSNKARFKYKVRFEDEAANRGKKSSKNNSKQQSPKRSNKKWKRIAVKQARYLEAELQSHSGVAEGKDADEDDSKDADDKEKPTVLERAVAQTMSTSLGTVEGKDDEGVTLLGLNVQASAPVLALPFRQPNKPNQTDGDEEYLYDEDDWYEADDTDKSSPTTSQRRVAKKMAKARGAQWNIDTNVDANKSNSAKANNFAPPFPRRWGSPPSGSVPDEDEDYDMNDWYELPGGYGKGSAELRDWVKAKVSKDKSKGRGTRAGRTFLTSKPFPRHWGGPPVGSMVDADDGGNDEANWVELPEGYGSGTSTLSKWIQRKLRKDRSKGRASHSTSVLTKRFPENWGVAPDEDEYGGYDMDDWVELPEGYGRGPPPLAKWVQSKLQSDDPAAAKAKAKAKAKPSAGKRSKGRNEVWTKVEDYEDSSEDEQLSPTDFGVVNVNGRMQLVGVELFEFYDDPAIQAALEATLLVAADPPEHLAQAVAAHIVGLSSAPDGSAKINFQVRMQSPRSVRTHKARMEFIMECLEVKERLEAMILKRPASFVSCFSQKVTEQGGHQSLRDARPDLAIAGAIVRDVEEVKVIHDTDESDLEKKAKNGNKVRGSFALRGITADMMQDEQRLAMRMALAEIPFELGLDTTKDDVAIDKVIQQADGTIKIEYSILLREKDMQINSDLVTDALEEIRTTVNRKGGMRLFNSICRAADAIGDHSWAMMTDAVIIGDKDNAANVASLMRPVSLLGRSNALLPKTKLGALPVKSSLFTAPESRKKPSKLAAVQPDAKPEISGMRPLTPAEPVLRENQFS